MHYLELDYKNAGLRTASLHAVEYWVYVFLVAGSLLVTDLFKQGNLLEGVFKSRREN